mgnify:FL=1
MLVECPSCGERIEVAVCDLQDDVVCANCGDMFPVGLPSELSDSEAEWSWIAR